MTDSTDDDNSFSPSSCSDMPPLAAGATCTLTNNPQGSIGKSSQRPLRSHHTGDMCMFPILETCCPVLQQHESQGNIFSCDMVPQRGLYSQAHLSRAVPPSVYTPETSQSRISCIQPLSSIPPNITSSASGMPRVPPRLESRSISWSAPHGSQVQSKSPVTIKQDVTPYCPGTSRMPHSLVDSHLHKPVPDRTPSGLPSGSPTRLHAEANPTQDDHAALEGNHPTPCLNLTCWPRSIDRSQKFSDIQFAQGKLESHAGLDLITKNGNCSKAAAFPQGSSLKTEHCKSAIVSQEVQQHSQYFRQDTRSLKQALPDRNLDHCQPLYSLVESGPRPKFNKDSCIDESPRTSQDAQHLQTVETSLKLERHLMDCLWGEGQPLECGVKSEIAHVQCLPQTNLAAFPQEFISEHFHILPESLPPASTQITDASELPADDEQSPCDSPEFSEEITRDSVDRRDRVPEGVDNEDVRVQPPSDHKCPVCGDIVSGYHYGIYSCESCKGFFKRTIHSKRFERLKCSLSGTCVITLGTRKQCASCRFQKCLSLGMKLEAIRSNRQRGGRSLYAGSSEQRRLSKLLELTSTPAKKRKPRDSNCTHQAKVLTDQSQDLGSLHLGSLHLASTESGAGTLLRKVHAGARQDGSEVKTKLQLKVQPSPLPIIIQDLLDNEILFVQQSFADCCLNVLREEKNLIVTLSHIINHKMQHLIRWVRGLPLYSELTIKDQVSLLHKSVLGILCLNLIFYCLDEAGCLLMPGNQVIDLTYFSISKFNQLVPKITNIGKQLHKCGLDKNIFVCLKLMLLLNPDTTTLQNREQVRSYQISIQNTFFAFMSKQLPKKRRIAGTLMLSLAAIERVSQQVTLETICDLEVLDEMFQCSKFSLQRPWIRSRFL